MVSAATPSDLSLFFCSCLNCDSYSHYCASLADIEKSQKIDDLSVLATCQSGTLLIFFSKVNGPIAHESTQ